MKYLFCLLTFCNFVCYSQITSIPDTQFEQALIDQNIDSDGVINGQVLTSDINNLNNLNLGFYFISDLTGLQDFVQLQNITIDNLDLSNNNLSLDLTENSMLEALTMFGGDDAFTHNVEKIDLSENLNINLIQTSGIWPLRQIDLKTGTTDVSNLNINISIAPNDFQGGSLENLSNDLFCIKVTDEATATAGTGVYSTWSITADFNPYYFSETCALSTDRFNDIKVRIYPNPTTEILNIETNNFQFNAIKIYNLQGLLVMAIKNPTSEIINVSELASAMYVIHLENDIGTVRKKILKQ